MANTQAYTNFGKNFSSIDELLKLHTLIIKDYPLLQEQSDELLRAVVVLSVSALDNYLHDFYRTEIVEGFLGKGNFNVKFENIKVSIKVLKEMDDSFSEAEKRTFLNKEVRAMQKTESFQSQRSIENIFNNLDIKNVWSKIEGEVGIKAKDIRDELGLIIDRRNKISHEADWDFFTQQKNPVEKAEVEYVVQFIKKFVGGIEKLIP